MKHIDPISKQELTISRVTLPARSLLQGGQYSRDPAVLGAKLGLSKTEPVRQPAPTEHYYPFHSFLEGL